MKILPEIKLRTRKSPLNSVNDPDPPWWRSELSDCSCYAVYCFGFPWWKGPGAMWLVRTQEPTNLLTDIVRSDPTILSWAHSYLRRL